MANKAKPSRQDFASFLGGLASVIEHLPFGDHRDEKQAFLSAVRKLSTCRSAETKVFLAFECGRLYERMGLAEPAEKGHRAAERAKTNNHSRSAKASARHAEWLEYAREILPIHRDENGRVWRTEIYKAVRDRFRLKDEKQAANVLKPFLDQLLSETTIVIS